MKWFSPSIVCMCLVFFITTPVVFANSEQCIQALVSGEITSYARLTPIYQLLEDDKDVVFLSLTFEDDQAAFTASLRELKSLDAQFTSEGFIGFSSLRQPFRAMFGLANKGYGHIYLMATKADLIRMRHALDLADQVETRRSFGSYKNGVLKAKRTTEEKINPNYLNKWQDLAAKEGRHQVTLVSSTSRRHFKKLVKTLQEDPECLIKKTYFNPVQSISWIVVEGTVDELRAVIERHDFIHEVVVRNQNAE